MERFILHVDMDAFYAAVEQRDNPEYRNKPVVIGSDPLKGRGVVSTCSYEARNYGIRSAMPISEAYRRCPNAIFVSPNMTKYLEVSKAIFEIFYDFSPHVEGISVDEAFIDITGSHHLFGGPHSVAQQIRYRIKDELQLSASVGLAPNKMLAKIASDLNKPDAFTVVDANNTEAFLYPLDLSRLWGVGAKTLAILHALGLYNVGDLASYDPNKLSKKIGSHAFDLCRLAQGKDERPVAARIGLDSMSNEHTFDKDIDDKEILLSALMYLSQKVSDRLRFKDLKAKTVSIKVRLKGFDTYTRSKTISQSTNYLDDIYKIAKDLFNEFLDGRQVRLIGVKLSNWQDKDQLSLDLNTDSKKEQIHRALDDIKLKFGKNAIGRARAL